MEGKVVLLTGANRGIGLESTRELARLGAHVVMVCRDQGLATCAMDDIHETTGSDRLETMRADLSSMAEVRAFAKAFRAKHDRLDVLVNNAAIVPRKRQVTGEGIELQLAVNHLAPFLLTHLLMDVLRESAPARVVNVSSGTHVRARIDRDDLQAVRGYRGMRRYSATKLMNILFTRALARRLEGTGVSAICLTPGFRHTGLSRDYKPFLDGVVRLMAGTPEEGAALVIHGISSPELEGVSGVYIDRHMEIADPSDRAMDDETGEWLWKESERLVELSPEERLPNPVERT
jgi:NAD(P)-dependent dehydrogenase (short-subunit alcohol dehydrogenase family)